MHCTQYQWRSAVQKNREDLLGTDRSVLVLAPNSGSHSGNGYLPLLSSLRVQGSSGEVRKSLKNSKPHKGNTSPVAPFPCIFSKLTNRVKASVRAETGERPSGEVRAEASTGHFPKN